MREVDPTWEPPRSITSTIEGEIAHHEAVARAAESRLAEIRRDAIPGFNPAWGVNRLTRELHEQGYAFDRAARGDGLIYRNSTGD